MTQTIETDIAAIVHDIAKARGASFVTALFSDPWAGQVLAVAMPFSTTRNGAKAKRWRWHGAVTMPSATAKAAHSLAVRAYRDARFASVTDTRALEVTA